MMIVYWYLFSNHFIEIVKSGTGWLYNAEWHNCVFLSSVYVCTWLGPSIHYQVHQKVLAAFVQSQAQQAI